MAGFNISSLITGFDSQALIDGLVAVEKNPERAIERRKTIAQSHSDEYGVISSNLSALNSAAKNLNTPNLLQAITASSSNTSLVQVTAANSASIGTYSIDTSALAYAQTNRSTAYASNSAGIAGTGSVGIRVGSGTTYTVSYGSSDTLSTIASNITNSGAAVTASVVSDGTNYRIMVTGTNTGASNSITYTDGGTALGFNTGGNQTQAAQDAAFTLNGMSFTRSTNTFSDVLTGVTMTLINTRGSAAVPVISVSNDPNGIATKLQPFIDNWNALALRVNKNLKFSGSGHPDPLSLFGNPTLQDLQRRMNSVITATYSDSSSSTSADRLGITQNRDGTLSFDKAKFVNAITGDTNVAKRLILGYDNGASGLAYAVNSMYVDYAQSGTGLIPAAQDGIAKQIKIYDQQVDRIENRAQQLHDRLVAQFSALNSIMTKLNSQSTSLNALDRK